MEDYLTLHFAVHVKLSAPEKLYWIILSDVNLPDTISGVSEILLLEWWSHKYHVHMFPCHIHLLRDTVQGSDLAESPSTITRWNEEIIVKAINLDNSLILTTNERCCLSQTLFKSFWKMFPVLKERHFFSLSISIADFQDGTETQTRSCIAPVFLPGSLTFHILPHKSQS